VHDKALGAIGAFEDFEFGLAEHALQRADLDIGVEQKREHSKQAGEPYGEAGVVALFRHRMS